MRVPKRGRHFQVPAESDTKWHNVDKWAFTATSNLTDQPVEYVGFNRREAGWRAEWVFDVDDSEQAYEYGIALEDTIDVIPEGPPLEFGGRRRVSIRLYTWVLEKDYQYAKDPQWITTGWALNARDATLRHYEYLRNYSHAVAQGIESRRLIATALEIVWWTERDTTARGLIDDRKEVLT